VSARSGLALALAAAWLAVGFAAGGAPDPSPAPAASDAPAAPMTNEDVVRMAAAGTPEREIVRAIQARPEAFDLATDMLDELRLAGVPASVIAAMQRRHAESAPATPPPERTLRGRAHLTVTLNASGLAPRTLKAPRFADEDAKERLKLAKENEQREVKDLGVFLACVTAEHVPDLWRSKSPLGRDMASVPRHEILAFVAGDTPAGQAPRLTLPDRIEADVDDSDPHDLVLGVAARIGDHWVMVGIAKLAKVTVGPPGATLVGHITRGLVPMNFSVKLEAKPERPG